MGNNICTVQIFLFLPCVKDWFVLNIGRLAMSKVRILGRYIALFKTDVYRRLSISQPLELMTKLFPGLIKSYF